MPRMFSRCATPILALAILVVAAPVPAQQRPAQQESPREKVARLQQLESEYVSLLNDWRACLDSDDCIAVEARSVFRELPNFIHRVPRHELLRQLRQWRLAGLLNAAQIGQLSELSFTMDLEGYARQLLERSDELKERLRRSELPAWEKSLAEIRRQVAVADRQAHEYDPRRTARPLVWELVATWDAPATQAPTSVRQAKASGSAAGGEAQVTYSHGNCTEMRTSDWSLSGDLGILTERSRIGVTMSYEIIPPGCSDGRFGFVAIDLGFRPAFMHERLRQMGPTYRFVDDVFGAQPASAGASSLDRSRMSSTGSGTINVLRRPNAYNEVAEFRILTSVPGYAVVVAYVFRAVPEP